MEVVGLGVDAIGVVVIVVAHHPRDDRAGKIVDAIGGESMEDGNRCLKSMAAV